MEEILSLSRNVGESEKVGKESKKQGHRSTLENKCLSFLKFALLRHTNIRKRFEFSKFNSLIFNLFRKWRSGVIGTLKGELGEMEKKKKPSENHLIRLRAGNYDGDLLFLETSRNLIDDTIFQQLGIMLSLPDISVPQQF